MLQSPRQAPLPLSELCKRIHEISSLPHVAIRVLEVANMPNAGARELMEVMEGDAALSTRVLRCVNSSAYATRTKITNLQQAIAYLGVKQVRNLAMTVSVSRLFEKEENIGPYNRKGLWRHLIAVGVCARLIAMRLHIRHFEDVFLAGLLHDAGIILEDQHVHDGFVEVVQSLREGARLSDVEREQLGFDHTTLGEYMAKTWQLPNGLTDAVRYHHDSTGYTADYPETVRCVELANFVCSLRGLSSVGVHLVEFPRAAITALSLGKNDLVVLANDLNRELANNQSLLQM
jgi:HD-like signal output (HDOD) protein